MVWKKPTWYKLQIKNISQTDNCEKKFHEKEKAFALFENNHLITHA